MWFQELFKTVNWSRESGEIVNSDRDHPNTIRMMMSDINGELARIDEDVKRIVKGMDWEVRYVMHSVSVIGEVKKGAMIGLIFPSLVPYALGGLIGGSLLSRKHGGVLVGAMVGSLVGLLVALPCLLITLPVGAVLSIPGALIGASIGIGSQIKSAYISGTVIAKNMREIYREIYGFQEQLGVIEAIRYNDTEHLSGVYQQINDLITSTMEMARSRDASGVNFEAQPIFSVNELIDDDVDPAIKMLLMRLCSYHRFRMAKITVQIIRRALAFFAGYYNCGPVEKISVVMTIFYYLKHDVHYRAISAQGGPSLFERIFREGVYD